MAASVEELEAEALCLPADQRANLVKKLIASRDAEPDADAAWAEEVEWRHAEIEAETVELLPGLLESRVSMRYTLHPETELDLREAVAHHSRRLGYWWKQKC